MAKIETADSPTQIELDSNSELIAKITDALITAGHQPQRMGALIHHIGSRFTNLWISPVMRNTKVICGKFVIKIGSRDIVWTQDDPHKKELKELIFWIEDWLETTSESL